MGDRRKRGVLVCFVGIDGAGKSTLARLLMEAASQRGIACSYVWAGFDSSFMIFKPLMALMTRSVFRGPRYMQESKTKGRVLKSARLSALYQYLALADYTFQAALRIELPLRMGRNVVCDRYIYDLVASIGLLLDYADDTTVTVLDRVLRFLPKPDTVFLIDVPEAVAYGRKDDIVSLDSLSGRRRIYLRLAEQHSMIILDGTRDTHALQESLVAIALPGMAGRAE